MKQCVKGFSLLILLLVPAIVHAQKGGGAAEPQNQTTTQLQDQYDVSTIRNLTSDEWLELSTDDRLRALSTSLSHEENKTYLGDFGRYYQKYRKWGYEYYEMEDRYETFAFRGFENYNILENRRRRWSYNEFGDRIPRMGSNATLWSEYHYGNGEFQATNPGNYINSIAQGSLDGIWVAQETTDDWSLAVVSSGMVRNKFTPLTYSQPMADGTRIDFQTANNQFSIFNSALADEIVNTWTFPNGGIMLRGGYFRRKIGALTLGATYVNEYVVQGTREGSDTWYGSAHNYMPTPSVVAVRFVDDSPDDNEGGPTIYDVHLKINGRKRNDILPRVIKDNLLREKTTALVDQGERAYIDPRIDTGAASIDFDALNVYETIPHYVDYMFIVDHQEGHNIDFGPSGSYSLELSNEYYEEINPGSLPIQVSGDDYLVFLYDIMSVDGRINRIEIEALVANDYRIQTSQFVTKSPGSNGHSPNENISTWYTGTYWTTRAQSDGNVKDGSNLTRLTVDIGYQVASINYGFDADFNYLGLQIKAEYVTNSNHYMFADGAAGEGEPSTITTAQQRRTGHRWAQLDNAWYVVAQKDWSMFGVAGEVFKMGKFYKPWLMFHMGVQRQGAYGQRNYSVNIPLIEDNDDDDAYADTNWEDRSINLGTAGALSSFIDPDGVFPGNDYDNDGIADNNKNLNSIPDYDENFLMFDVDPDEYVFGDDYNNNTVPDFREDDPKYDTPYDLDRQGRHINFRFTPVQSVNLVVGSFRTEGVGLDTRTNDDYFKFNMNYDVFSVGKLYAEYRYEKIQDNVRDVYFKVNTRMNDKTYQAGTGIATGRFSRSLYFDELEYRNSKVNRIFLQSTIRAVPSITLENHVRLENNKQVEGTMFDGIYQPLDELNTLAMVNKLIYTRQWGNFIFSPGVKFRLYKKSRSESLQPLDHSMLRIPMIIFKYIISDRTMVTLGLQGVQGFQLYYKDYVQSDNDYRQKNYLFQIENRSDYYGYQIWTGMGFALDQVDYQSKYRNFENYKSSEFFIRMLCGW